MSLRAAVVMDGEGMVTQWTPLAEELFGYTSSDAIGTALGNLIVPEAMRPYHEMGLRRYVTTRDPHCVGFLVEVEAVHKKGHRVPIQMRILPTEEGPELFFVAHVAPL